MNRLVEVSPESVPERGPERGTRKALPAGWELNQS